MRKLLQLGMALVVSAGILFGQWWFVPCPEYGQRSFSEADFRRWDAAERRQKIESRNSRLIKDTFERTECVSARRQTLSDQVAHHVHNLPARLVAAVIVVESGCDPQKISATGDVGLMQVNSKIWHRSRKELLDPDRNLEIGTRILARDIRIGGSVREGLKRYHGFSGGDEYADKVLTIARME